MNDKIRNAAGWAGTLLVILAIFAALTCGAAAAEKVENPLLTDTRPAWCQRGYVCIPTKDAADLLIRIENLEAQVSVFKATKRRALGYAAVCGPAISLSAEDGNTTFAGTLSCAIGIGYRF